MNKCTKCEYEWEPRIVTPVQCPRCKRHDWGAKLKKRNSTIIHKLRRYQK